MKWEYQKTVQAKPVKRIDVDGTEKIYPSANAAKKDGFNPSNICLVANGFRTFHRGYDWEFVKPEEAKEILKFR